MIENIFEIDLPIGEKFYIKRKRFQPEDKTITKRISIISGIHGDELEGQYVCYLLSSFLERYKPHINGIIDIYPSINSVGIDSIERLHVPSEVDLNRAFPGSHSGFLPERIAYHLTEAVKGSEIAIDIHSSNIFLKEVPQVRISEENADVLMPIANELNLDFIWIHQSVTVLQSTFAHTLNSLGTKTLVVEMGVGMRLTEVYCKQLFDGIIHLLIENGFLNISFNRVIKKPICSLNGEVLFFNAKSAGLFVPDTEHDEYIKKGELIGKVVSPLNGTVEEEIISPSDGFVFTLRIFPLVYEGSLVARVYQEKK